MMANWFAVNESDREPSKSISALFEVVATAEAVVEMGPAAKKKKDERCEFPIMGTFIVGVTVIKANLNCLKPFFHK